MARVAFVLAVVVAVFSVRETDELNLSRLRRTTDVLPRLN